MHMAILVTMVCLLHVTTLILNAHSYVSAVGLEQPFVLHEYIAILFISMHYSYVYEWKL